MSMPDSSASAAASHNEAEHKSSDAETEAQAARRELLAEYLYKMTGGNPNLIQGMFEALEISKVIHTLPDATKCVDSAYKDMAALQKLEVPERLSGLALSFFERLDPMEQTVLKALSACANDVGGLHELTAALPSIGMDKIAYICGNLTQQSSRALRREDIKLKQTLAPQRASLSNYGYRFAKVSMLSANSTSWCQTSV